jgi:glycosyltransferase involved in cell wall biosynthesis
MASIALALATYNGAKYLAPFLDSVLAQDRKPDRIVVVDDASTDGTIAILEQYAARLPLEIHRRSSNGGHRVAFTEALSHVREDWVFLADQDDLWEPHKIATLISAAGNADLVHSDALVIDEQSQVIQRSWHRGMGHAMRQVTENYLFGWNNVTGCTAAFSQSLLRRVMPIPSGVPVHDWWLALAASAGKGIQYVDEPLIRYRIHSGNAVGRGKPLAFSESLRQQSAWFETVVLAGPSIGLNPTQILFADRMARISRQRLMRAVLPEWFPWIWSMRRFLFEPGLSEVQQASKAVMTSLGFPLLRLMGKK